MAYDPVIEMDDAGRLIPHPDAEPSLVLEGAVRLLTFWQTTGGDLDSYRQNVDGDTLLMVTLLCDEIYFGTREWFFNFDDAAADRARGPRQFTNAEAALRSALSELGTGRWEESAPLFNGVRERLEQRLPWHRVIDPIPLTRAFRRQFVWLLIDWTIRRCSDLPDPELAEIFDRYCDEFQGVALDSEAVPARPDHVIELALRMDATNRARVWRAGYRRAHASDHSDIVFGPGYDTGEEDGHDEYTGA